MSRKLDIKTFESSNIRVAWDDEPQEWYFSVVDVVEALADSTNPTDYLKKMRKRDPELAEGWGQIVTPLPVDTAGGRQKTNFATKEGVFRIIQSISSPRKEQFRQWVEQVTSRSSQIEDLTQPSVIEDVQGEILLYQPDETVRLEVLMEHETVWLTQAQMAELFQKNQSDIAKHIRNVFREGELTPTSNMQILHKTLSRYRPTKIYNLNVIISVGYRVKSKRGTQFRIWATSILKNYLLRGYAINQQLMRLEQRIDVKLDAQQIEIQKIESTLADHQEKIDFFVRTNQPPVEGVLFEGQIFDAYKLVEAFIKSAKREIILIDNYIDASIFDLLEKREQGVDVTIYTEHVGQSLLHMQQLNQQQYGRKIKIKEYNSRFHDRFLILDDALYHFGASFKDLGKRLFAFELMGIDKNIILSQL